MSEFHLSYARQLKVRIRRDLLVNGYITFRIRQSEQSFLSLFCCEGRFYGDVTRRTYKAVFTGRSAFEVLTQLTPIVSPSNPFWHETKILNMRVTPAKGHKGWAGLTIDPCDDAKFQMRRKKVLSKAFNPRARVTIESRLVKHTVNRHVGQGSEAWNIFSNHYRCRYTYFTLPLSNRMRRKKRARVV